MEDNTLAQILELGTEELIQVAVSNNEGVIASNGALSLETGERTGRSPNDRFIVEEDSTSHLIDWGNINKPFDANKFSLLWDKVDAYLAEKDRYLSKVHVGAHEDHYIPVNVISESASHSLFSKLIFINPSEFNHQGKQEWQILSALNYQCAPEEDGKDDHDRMQTGAFAHDFGREEPAFDILHDDENETNFAHQQPPSFWLEKGEWQGDAQTDDGAEIGHDVEHAQGESQHQGKFESDRRESDEQHQSHQQADQELSSEKGYNDRNELLDEEDDIFPDRYVEKGEVVLDAAGGFVPGEQKEEEVDRNDRQICDKTEQVECPGAGGLDRRQCLGEQMLSLRQGRIDDRADRRVGHLALGEGHPIWVVGLHIEKRPLPEDGHKLDEIEHLLDQFGCDPEHQAGDDQGDGGIKNHDRGHARSFDVLFQPVNQGTQHQVLECFAKVANAF